MINCPSCSSILTSNNTLTNGFLTYKCPNCYHEFFKPEGINDIHINSELYKNDPDYIGDLANSKDYKYLIQWNHIRAAKILKEKTQIRTLLDIGTFNGFFVKYMRNKGYEAYGIDFNEDAIKNGIENYRLNSKLSVNVEDFKIDEFDCVSAFEVIEHLEEPNGFLQDISKLLKRGGILILSCPNNKMLWRSPVEYPPHHLSRFSPDSLTKMVENHGFEVIQHDEQMSFLDLSRNYFGSLLRDSNKSSLKGGAHKKSFFVDPARFFLNKYRVLFYFLLVPVDRALFYFGFRYICQIVIAKKK